MVQVDMVRDRYGRSRMSILRRLHVFQERLVDGIAVVLVEWNSG
jgi:hypothetical protein